MGQYKQRPRQTKLASVRGLLLPDDHSEGMVMGNKQKLQGEASLVAKAVRQIHVSYFLVTSYSKQQVFHG